MNLKPFFSYYGGKYRLAPRYTSPQYDIIIEPFAGSAGYSVRHPQKNVILYDLDEKVIGTWQYLIRVTPEEILSLPEHVEHVDNHPSLTQEQQWLIGWWLGRGGAQPKQKKSPWGVNHDREACFWGPMVTQRLASQVEEIRHWKAIQGSYADIPNTPATWFVDPPYQKMGKYYKHGSKGIDFQHLGEWCQSREGHVIVCENEGADWLPFTHFHNAKASDGPQKKSNISIEVIWEKGAYTPFEDS
jgi:site-specific DNA-adenine methylase